MLTVVKLPDQVQVYLVPVPDASDSPPLGAVTVTGRPAARRRPRRGVDHAVAGVAIPAARGLDARTSCDVVRELVLTGPASTGFFERINPHTRPRTAWRTRCR